MATGPEAGAGGARLGADALVESGSDAPRRRLVVMVCAGNICRSPIAEAVLRLRLAQAGVDDVVVRSAGTGSWHVGDDADPRARAVLAHHDIPLRHRAAAFRPEWLASAHLVLAMDGDNLTELRRRAPDAPGRARVRLLRSFDPECAGLAETDPSCWVIDPYYGSSADFARTLSDVESAVVGVVAELRRP